MTWPAKNATASAIAVATNANFLTKLTTATNV